MNRSSYQRRSYQTAKPRSVARTLPRTAVKRHKTSGERREYKPETDLQQQILDQAKSKSDKSVDQQIKKEHDKKDHAPKTIGKTTVKKSFNQTVKYTTDTVITDIIPAPRRPKAVEPTEHNAIKQASNNDKISSSITETAESKSAEPKAKKTRKISKNRRAKQNHEKRQTIGEHIDEFRRRLLYCVLALVIGGAIGYRFQNEIIAWLVKPLGQQLFYTSPTGGFDFLIKICLFFGFLLAVPVIIYNFIRFLAPAVPERVRYSTVKLLFASMVLAVMGVAFAYFVSLPAALHFLNNFTNDQIQSLISAQEYFNFVMLYLAGFAALFQMPLIFAFINKVTPLKPSILMQKQRLVILISFVVAAVLTPTPDPMNQTLMAIPIIGLYQTSVGVVWQENRRKLRKQSKGERLSTDSELAVAT